MNVTGSPMGAQHNQALEALAALSRMLFIGWYFGMLFGTALAYQPIVSSAVFLLPSVTFLLGSTIGSASLLKLAGSLRESCDQPRTVCYFALIATLSPLYTTLVLIGLIPHSLALSLVLAGVAGLSGVFFSAAHEDLGRRIQVTTTVRYSSLCSVGGAALFLIVTTLGEETLRAVCSILFILSGAVLFIHTAKQASSENPLVEAEQKATFNLDGRVSILLFVFNIAFGIAWVYALDFSSLYVYVAIGVVIVTLTGFAIAFWHGKRVKDDYILLLMRACIGVIAVAFALFALDILLVQYVSFIIVIALWPSLWVMVNGILLQHTIDFDLPIIEHVTWSSIAQNLGFLVGWGIGSSLLFIMPAEANSSVLVSTILVVVAIVVLLGMLLLPINRTSDALFTAASESEDIPVAQNVAMADPEREVEDICSVIAKMYELSPREYEIACYLAKGRNAKYISSKIFISEYTVRTHIYNIYRKLDVHSKQDLIDLVDEHRQSRRLPKPF